MMKFTKSTKGSWSNKVEKFINAIKNCRCWQITDTTNNTVTKSTCITFSKLKRPDSEIVKRKLKGVSLLPQFIVAYWLLIKPWCSSCVNRKTVMRTCKQFTWVDIWKQVKCVDNRGRWKIIYTRAPTSSGQSRSHVRHKAIESTVSHVRRHPWWSG